MMTGWHKSWPPDLPSIYCKNLKNRVYTHSSVNHKINKNNDRLEFLGDSVLGLVIADMLHEGHPNMTPGDMTQVRSKLACNAQLAEWAVELYDLNQKLNKNVTNKIEQREDRKRKRNNRKNKGAVYPKHYADVFEAYIGAVYLESGYNVVRDWLQVLFEPLLQNNVPFIRKSDKLIEHPCLELDQAYDKEGGEIQYTFDKERQILRCHTDVLVLSEVPLDAELTEQETREKAARKALEYQGVVHTLQMRRIMKKKPWSIISKSQRNSEAKVHRMVTIDSDGEVVYEPDKREVVDLTDDNEESDEPDINTNDNDNEDINTDDIELIDESTIIISDDDEPVTKKQRISE